MKPKGKANADDIEIGDNLKRLRQSRGMAQEAVGDALGISFQQIQKYEQGKNRISASRLCSIADFFKVPLLALLPLRYRDREAVTMYGRIEKADSLKGSLEEIHGITKRALKPSSST